MKGIEKKNLTNDILAGIIVALVSIPISMGYATIAGLPVIYGLYSSILPVLIYAVLTTSPQFVLGVDATPAALVGGTLATLGIATGSEEALAVVPMITLISAVWLFIFFVLRAGRIVNYISTPVMGGFISGIGVTIILMQISKLFGGGAGTGELFELMIHIYGQFKHFNALSAALGFGTVVIILVAKRLAPKFPMSVVLMVLGAIATKYFHIDKYGVALLPNVDGGMPSFALPDMSLMLEHTMDYIVLGLSVAGVIMAQTLLATNNYANKYDYKVNNNREVLAYAAANLSSALMGSCPVNGSVSRTGIADQYGCKSQIMSITAAIFMMAVVAFGTPVLAYLPVPILTGIVVAALIGIVEYKMAIKLFKTNRTEFFIFVGAFMGVLLLGTIYGVLVGMVLSFVAVLMRAVVPPKAFLGVIPGNEGFYSLARYRKAMAIVDTVIYRFNGTLFFANVNTFVDDIENAVTDNTKQVVVDASGIGTIDITAAERLLGLNRKLRQRGIKFYITEHGYELNDQLRELGAGSLVEEGVVRRTITLALRDAGLVRPYPTDRADTYEVEEVALETNERLAEIEWAFGKDADEWLDKMAAEMADEMVSEMAENADKDVDIVREVETHNSWGRIGLFDEDELLEHLEIHLSESSIKPDINFEDIEKRIDERRMIVEDKLSKINPEALTILKEHRLAVLNKLKENNPKAYAHLMQQRRKHIEHLEKRDPKLATKLRHLYNIKD